MHVRSAVILCIIPVGGFYKFRMGYGVRCCLPEGCVRFTFSQLPTTTSSSFLSARVYLRVSAQHPRRESRIPSERDRNDTPLLPSSPPPPFISSDFSVVLAGGPSASFPAGRCPRAGETGRTPRGYNGKIVSQTNGRKEQLFQLNTPPRLRQSLSGVERSSNSTAALSPVCWRRSGCAEFLGFPLRSRELVCARVFASLALC